MLFSNHCIHMLGRQSQQRWLRYFSLSSRSLSSPYINIDRAEESLASNETLARLKEAYVNGNFQVVETLGTGDINSDRSLPMTKFLKKEIFDKVINDSEINSWRKPFTKWFRLGIYVMKYYKEGIKNTYLIYKETAPIYKEYEKNSKTPLITQMYKLIEYNEIKFRFDKGSKVLPSLPLTRSQYVDYYRRNQVWKLPVLIISLVLLEELTAILFYLFPKLAPHNCLTPGAFLKITKNHTNETTFENPLIYKSPHALTKNEMFSILRRTSIIEIPFWKLKVFEKLNNKKIPCEKLARLHQYVFVDDWLLLQSILGNSSTRLTYKELVNCIWERQLYSAEEDLNEMVNDEKARHVLIWRLFTYWSFRFNGTITVGGNKLFSEKWGINNISIFNFSGLKNNKLLGLRDAVVLGVSQNEQSNQMTDT